MSSNIRIQRICQHCGNEFTAKTTVTKYCGDLCAKRAYKDRMREKKIENSENETQEIKEQRLNELKEKDFLSINETSVLLGISIRTIYRMISRKELKTGKAGARTIIKRTEIDKLFK